MKVPWKRDKRSNLDKEIDRILLELEDLDSLSEEYNRLLGRLNLLYDAKSKEKDKKSVSPDVVWTIAANLLGLGLIMNHEKLNVISTKALNFVLRTRV